MTDEIKAGRRHSESDIALGRKIKAALTSSVADLESLGFVDDPTPTEWAAPDPSKSASLTDLTTEIVTAAGGEVKAVGDDRLQGYLVRFTSPDSPDLTGDYFTKSTDFGIENGAKTPVYFHHRMPFETSDGRQLVLKAKIGDAVMTVDDVGVFVDAVIYNRKKYEKAIVQMGREDLLGWSSGTASHLVDRKAVGDVHEITKWQLGFDATLTMSPAEPRNAANTLKAYIAELEAGQPASDGALGQAEAVEAVVSEPVSPTEELNMSDNTQAAPAVDTTEIMAKLAKMSEQLDAMKAAPVERVGGIAEMVDAGKAPSVKTIRETFAEEQLSALKAALKHEIGRDEWKAHQAKVASNAEHEAHRKAYDAWLRNPDDYTTRAALRDAQMKTSLVEGTASLGGNLVPQLYNNQMVGTLIEDSIVRRAGAYQFPVQGTNALNVTTITRSASAAIVAEGASVAGQEPTFGTTSFVPYAYKALYVASREVIADSRFNLSGVLNDNFMWQFIQSENNHFAVGTGASQPQGIAAGATSAVSAGSTLALATANGDYIMDLFHSLPYQYRDNAVWFANDQVIKAIRKIKDLSGGAASTGNYLWQPGLQAGQPDRLLGRPIYPLNTMASSGSTANVLVIADPRFFWIADFNLGGTEVQQLNERYADLWQIGWTAWRRFDSHLVVSEAAKGMLLR